MPEFAVLSSPHRAIAVALLLVACDHERTVLIEDVPRDFAVTVRVDGAVVPSEWRSDRVRARITAPAAAVVTLTAAGPCGPVELPLERVEHARANELYVPRDRPAVRRVLLDVRGAGATTVTIGALAVDAGAGGQRAIEFPIASCADGDVIRVNGEPIGQLPTDVRADVLVDADGSHCYRVQAEELVPMILAGLPGPTSAPMVTRLAPGHVHDLSPIHVDFPFAPVPERVDPDAIGRFDEGDVFTSVVAEACPPLAP